MKDKKIVLAPMAGYTDKTYREILWDMGIDLAYTEMISAKAIYYNDSKTEDLLRVANNERNLGVQLFGSDPEIISKVIRDRFNNDSKFNVVDINMGCPAPKIVKNGEGSALMLNPEKSKLIIYNARNALKNKRMSLKMRLGWDEKNKNVLEIAKIAEKEGVDFITIHGRTRQMYYSGKADWDYIKLVKEQLDIPVIANGDIFTAKDAEKILEITKADGVALARGVIGNPWLVKEIYNKFNGLEIYKERIEDIDRINMIKYHLSMHCENVGEYRGVKEMRKHISAYLKGMPSGKSVKDKINRVDNQSEIITILDEYSKIL